MKINREIIFKPFLEQPNLHTQHTIFQYSHILNLDCISFNIWVGIYQEIDN